LYYGNGMGYCDDFGCANRICVKTSQNYHAAIDLEYSLFEFVE
jgi:hypothetical protein